MIPAWYRDRYRMDGIPTHDPSAIAYAIDPSLFRVERLPLYVETAGRGAGQTLPDRFRHWQDVPIDVCVDMDSPRWLALFRERMQKPHPRPTATPSPERRSSRSGEGDEG